jgi:hypothetical protein
MNQDTNQPAPAPGVPASQHSGPHSAPQPLQGGRPHTGAEPKAEPKAEAKGEAKIEPKIELRPDQSPEPIKPQRRIISARAELAAAVDEVLALRPRLVRIAARDGAVFALEARRLVDALEALLHADKQARVRVLVDDPQWLETRAPRLKQAQRRYPHAIELRQASTDDPVGDDLHFIADAHSIDIRAGRLVSGDLWINNRSRAQPLAGTFDRRWAAAAHNLPVSPLGL